MRIIAKLFTLLRGKSHEAGQAVVDANAMTVLHLVRLDPIEMPQRNLDAPQCSHLH